MANTTGEKKLVSRNIDNKFMFYRILGVAILVGITFYLITIGSKITQEEKGLFLYLDENPVEGLTILDSDKSAFEDLDVSDIKDQFDKVVDNLKINQVKYEIKSGNIGIKDPYKGGKVRGNIYDPSEYENKDID